MKFNEFDKRKQQEQFIQAVWDMGYPNPFKDDEIVIDNKCAVELSRFGDKVSIRSLRCFDPRQGHGTEIMNRIIALADQYGVDLTLDAVPLEVRNKIPKKKLGEFYRRFGFKGKDYMNRTAQAK